MRDPFPTITRGNYRQGAPCVRVKIRRAPVVNQQHEPVRYMREGSETNYSELYVWLIAVLIDKHAQAGS